MDTPQLPSNTTAERAILSSMLLDASYYFLEDLQQDWFYDQLNRKVFAFIEENIFAKKEITAVAFEKEFTGSVDYYDLVSHALVLPSEEAYLSYVHEVKSSYEYRRLIAIAQRVYSLGYSQADMDVINAEIQKLIDIDKTDKTQYLVKGALETLGDTTTPKFVCETWYYDLDSVIRGFRCGWLVVVGARPWNGKSTLALNFVDKCLEQWTKCAFFSTEMTTREIQERFLCLKSGVSMPAMDARKQETIDEVLWKLSHVEYQYDCSVYDRITSVDNLVAAIHKECLQGAQLLVVDYIQQIPIDTRKWTRAEMLWQISTKLKQLAKQYNACIICCAQLNRELEKRTNKRPTKADLKDSWSLEQDADVVLLLEVHEDNESLLNIYVDKNRQWGANIMVQLKRDRKYFCIRSE